MTRALLIAIITLFAGSLSAQISQIWAKSYDGQDSELDWVRDAVGDGAGGVYAALAENMTSGAYRTVVQRYDAAGNVAWTEYYGGRDEDTPEAVAAHPAGGVLVGSKFESQSGLYNVRIAHYSASGMLEYESIFNSGEHDVCEDIGVDANGNVYVWVESFTDTSPQNRAGFHLVSYDAQGNFRWSTKRNPQPVQEEFSSFFDVNSSGEVGIRFSPTQRRLRILKFDNGGNQEWEREHSTALLSDTTSGVAIAANGDVFAGAVSEQSAGNFAGLVLRYDGNGNKQYEAFYGVSAYVNALVPSANGSVIVAGRDSSAGTQDAFVWKLAANGNRQWAQTYDVSGGVDVFTQLVETPSGSIMASGTGYSANTNHDAFTVSVDAAGNRVWEQTYDYMNANDEVRALVVEGVSVIVAGRGASAATVADGVIVKYSTNGAELEREQRRRERIDRRGCRQLHHHRCRCRRLACLHARSRRG